MRTGEAAARETEMGAMARVYVNTGLKVFPLWWVNGHRCACPNGRLPEDHQDFCGLRPDGTINGSPGKHPISGNGFKDASDDPERVAAWWTRYPLAHPGLPAGDNGLAVIDEDPRHGGTESLRRLRAALAERGRPIPETRTAITGSGGRHFLFAAPAGGIKNRANSFGTDLPGLDTRGRGGYIVAAPSRHVRGGVYEWVDFFAELAPWPSILTRVMDPPKAAATVRPIRGGSAPSGGYGAKALASEVAEVRATKEGSRNDRLNRAAFSLGQLVAGGVLDEARVTADLCAAGMATGLDQRSVLNTIASGLRGGKASPRQPRRAA